MKNFWGNITKHHVFYSVLAVLVLFVFFSWLRAHDAWKNMEGDIKADNVRIQNNKTVGKEADKKIETATSSNVAIDSNLKQQLQDLQHQVNQKLDSNQANDVVKRLLPGVQTVAAKDSQGNNLIAVEDNQANRDLINHADVDFKACVFNRDNCEEKQKNFLDIIAADNVKIGERDETIKTLTKENGKLKSFGKGGNIWARTGRVVIPIACAGGGAYLTGKFRSGQTNQGQAAAVGALVGGGSCAVVFHF